MDRFAVIIIDAWYIPYLKDIKHKVIMWKKEDVDRMKLQSEKIIKDIANFIAQCHKRKIPVIHSPYVCMNYYNNHKAKLKVDKTFYPPPKRERIWKYQHPDIPIDENNDIISTDVGIVDKFLKRKKIIKLYYTGFSTNICVLGRPLGMNKMKKKYNVCLISDLSHTLKDGYEEYLKRGFPLKYITLKDFYEEYKGDLIGEL
jgi:nicotinamidase-related amidase